MTQNPANTTVQEDSPKVIFDHALAKKLVKVLSVHFTNGFRVDSPIELMRFRRFEFEDFGKNIIASDNDLVRCISRCGTLFEGKIYVVSPQTKIRIRELVEKYFVSGAKIIFYSEFYSKNESWLFNSSVISKEMLKEMVLHLFPTLSFRSTYFGHIPIGTISSVLESEILRVWGDDMLLTYVQLAERLQYIPLKRIENVLSQNNDFIWNCEKTYSHISKIVITREELDAIRETVRLECNANDYISVTDLPLGEIEERNYKLSESARYNAVFHICLADKYDKKDRIIIRKGKTLDTLKIMKSHCRKVDKCSLGDLMNREKELTGNVTHRSLEAGYAVLVRVNRDTFVADKYVDFDTKTIDEAITRNVTKDYLPLKAFTTFAIFPHCGRAWNLFLLESFCRRFSNKFRFEAQCVNSRNAGTIIRKSCCMSYTEIMADAIAKSEIVLESALVGKYLFETGFTGKSTNKKIGEVIEKAKALREREGNL